MQAAHHPRLKLLGISTVAGNQSVEKVRTQTLRHSLRLPPNSTHGELTTPGRPPTAPHPRLPSLMYKHQVTRNALDVLEFAGAQAGWAAARASCVR